MTPMEGILETICSRFIFGYPQAKLWRIGRRCVTTTKDQTRFACEVEVYFGSRFWRVRFKGQVASGNKDPQLGVGVWVVSSHPLHGPMPSHLAPCTTSTSYGATAFGECRCWDQAFKNTWAFGGYSTPRQQHVVSM